MTTDPFFRGLKAALTVFLLSFMTASFAWGPTGHRAIGQIAENYLSKKAKRKIRSLLGGHNLAYWSNYADAIRSDKRYEKYNTWHYVNFKGMSYDPAMKNPKGDVVQAIRKCIEILKSQESSMKDKAFYLKLLIHFVGDLHQPLHVGRQDDLGGNLIKVKWFGKDSNLHRVWDEGMINHYKMSYTELAASYPDLSKKEQKKTQIGTVLEWANESKKIAEERVYPSVIKTKNLSYPYMYNYFLLLRSQLLKAGLRLAKVLNDIYK